MTNIKLRPHETNNWNDILKGLPDPKTIHPADGKRGEADVRNANCSNVDLSMYSIEDMAFDDKTIWPMDPKKLPQGFKHKDEIMEWGKNPGLGVHSLHVRGVDGSGMRMAIIDQSLSDHTEYHDNLVHYEEFGNVSPKGSMHGSAVSSIAVGKTLGVAPKAKLYYFANRHSRKDPKTGKDISFTDNCVKALKKIIEINETLPPNGKIQIVSMSWGGQSNKKITQGCDKWFAVLEKAKKAGLFVLTCASLKEYGLDFLGMGRKPLANPDASTSYRLASFCTTKFAKDFTDGPHPYGRKMIVVPMDDRTTASPLSNDGYVHYMAGGMSWATPWLAGMFVLARQVDPTVTPEHFWEVALKTGILSKEVGGSIIQPVALIDTLEKERAKALEKQKNAPKKKKTRTQGLLIRNAIAKEKQRKTLKERKK